MQRGILRNVQWDVPLIKLAVYLLLDRARSTFVSVATDAQFLYQLYVSPNYFVINYSFILLYHLYN